jgi:transposase
MPQQGRIVGIDISKRKVDACIRLLQQRLSKPATSQGEAELIAWLREHEVSLAVMEASGGYERPWAEALRKAGIGVRIVDPSACVTSPNRPESWPRTIRSMPR